MSQSYNVNKIQGGRHKRRKTYAFKSVGFALASDWLSKCYQIFKPITKRSRAEVYSRRSLGRKPLSVTVTFFVKPMLAFGPGSGPGRGHCVVFLGKTFYFHGASLHLGVQMVPAKLLGVTPRWTSIPSRGSRNTPSRFMPRKPEISAGLMGLPRLVTETLPFFTQCLH